MAKNVGLKAHGPGRISGVILLYTAIVLVLIGLRVYKAHTTGVVYDEYWTTRDFCENIQSPMTIYTSTNNHVLNSLSIVLIRSLAGNYEHYCRIHTVLWGALFCIGTACILRNVLQHFPLQVMLLLVILLNWFIFDLSYLARGYAIGLGVVFLMLAVYIHLQSRQAWQTLDGWPVTLLFIAMNFIAMGAMLSCMNIIFSFNGLYVLILLWRAKGQGPAVWKKRILQVITLIAGSGISLYLLYCRILPEVLKLGKAFKLGSFYGYMKKLLWTAFIKEHLMLKQQMVLCRQVYWFVAGLVVASLIVCIIYLLIRLKTVFKSCSPNMHPRTFLLLLTVCVFLLKLIQHYVMGVSLGMPRNSVIFQVLTLISCGIVIDQAVTILSRRTIIKVVCLFLCAGILGVFVYANLPSLRAVNVRSYGWGKESVMGPLVRTLRKIDPDETWGIKFSYAGSARGPMKYYQSFGYNVRSTGKDESYDVCIVREHFPNPNVVYLKYEDFLDHHCAVIINPAVFQNAPIYYQASPVSTVLPLK